VFGRLAPRQVTLDQPTITLDLDRPPFDSGFGELDVFRVLPPLPRVSLTNGVIRVVSRSHGFDTMLASVQGRLEGLFIGARMSVDLSAVWRNVPLTLSGSLEEPQRAAVGGQSPLTLGIASPLGDLKFDGALTAGATPTAAGDLAISSRALAEAFRWLGVAAPPVLRAADLAISGKIKASPEDVVFDEATVTSGGQTFQGALRLARVEGRLGISGSLDAERLSLAPLIGPPERLLSADGWNEKAFAAMPPRDFDLDVRLSAGRLDVYGAGFDNVAASALLKDGALTANLIDGTAYGGRGAFEVRLACDEGVLRAGMRGALKGADVGEIAAASGWPALSGKGGVEFAVESAGRSPAEFIAGLGGKASFTLEDGALSGVNLEEALRRNQRRPLDVSKDMRSGGTAFEKATLDVLIGQGVVHVANGSIVARGLRADLEGAVDLAARDLSLRLNAAQTEPTGAVSPDAAHLSLDIEGPWSDPAVRSVDATDAQVPTAQ